MGGSKGKIQNPCQDYPLFKSKNKQILKVTVLYLMWNPEICQDPHPPGAKMIWSFFDDFFDEFFDEFFSFLIFQKVFLNFNLLNHCEL